jgi:hypothetical protein
MATVPLSSITIPRHGEYDSNSPQINLENLCYVILQILEDGQAAGWMIPDPRDLTVAVQGMKSDLSMIRQNIYNIDQDLTALNTSLQDLKQALDDLQFQNAEFDMGFMKVNLYGYVQDVT